MGHEEQIEREAQRVMEETKGLSWMVLTEHNEWEGETFMFAVPATEHNKAAMRALGDASGCNVNHAQASLLVGMFGQEMRETVEDDPDAEYAGNTYMPLLTVFHNVSVPSVDEMMQSEKCTDIDQLINKGTWTGAFLPNKGVGFGCS